MADAANLVYMSLCQSSNESIASFKRRFDDALIALESTVYPVPPPRLQAARFLASLNPHRFSEMRTSIENSMVQTMHLYPLNLTEVFTLAATYRVFVITSGVEEPTVFLSENDYC